ncbi:MAG: hypothetical protein M3300_01260 [Actinomycetota bacterium]|nr:hypothetical protein [Actinomycetota bacterium]
MNWTVPITLAGVTCAIGSTNPPKPSGKRTRITISLVVVVAIAGPGDGIGDAGGLDDTQPHDGQQIAPASRPVTALIGPHARARSGQPAAATTPHPAPADVLKDPQPCVASSQQGGEPPPQRA